MTLGKKPKSCANDPTPQWVEEIKGLKAYLGREFEITDLGELRYFLRIEVAISNKRIVTLDLLEETRKLGRKLVDTPIEQNHGLHS